MRYRGADITAFFLGLWAILVHLFSTDVELVTLTLLTVLLNAVFRPHTAEGVPRNLWRGVKYFLETSSLLVVILAVAQAGANKYEYISFLGQASYFIVYLVMFGVLLVNIGKRNDDVARVTSVLGSVVSKYLKHYEEPGK